MDSDTPENPDQFPPPSDPSAERWLYWHLLPHVGKLYDELAKQSVVPTISGRGRPKGRRGLSKLTTEIIAVHAAFERDQRKRRMLEVGAMIETWESARGFVDSDALAVAIQKAEQSDVVEKRELKRRAREYVKEGRALRAMGEIYETWLQRGHNGGTVPPALLRRHFQLAIIRAVAGWLGEAKAHCDTHRPAYKVLAELLDERSVLSGLFWTLYDALPRVNRSHKKPR